MSSRSSSTVTPANTHRHAPHASPASGSYTRARSHASPSSRAINSRSSRSNKAIRERSVASSSSTSTPVPTRPATIRSELNESARKSKFPITPAVLRGIFASSRTLIEERTISRVAFFRFAGFLLSCLGISLVAARGRPVHGLGLGR